MNERVYVSCENGIADVRLNRPEKLNALDPAMFEALGAAGAKLMGDRTVRAVVLSGEGRAFCAGLDLSSFAAQVGGGAIADKLLSRRGEGPANVAQQATWVWTEVPVPVIAALHGAAYGGGLQIALGADIRIAAPDAQLSVMEVRWGLVPDMGATQTLRHLVRMDIAKELIFTGRVVSGREAAELGLVTRVADDPFGAALALAREIAARSPEAVRAAKRLLGQAPLVDVATGLRLEEQAQRALLGTANQLEAVAANLGKRTPLFRDPA
ncbi:MAG: crotonase/enoyl-CoA hydratase family protein [Candidatus Binatia bacterium]